MKLSIAMVAEALEGIQMRCAFHGFEYMLNLERFIFYNGEMELRKNTLYIFSPHIQSQYTLSPVSIETGTAMLFLGNDVNENCSAFQQAACIYIDRKSITVEELTNKLISVFEKYNRLDALMKKTIHSNDSLQELIGIATRLFDNEITLRNSLHQYVAQSYEKLCFMEDEDQEVDGYTPTQILGHLRADKNYKEQINNTEAWQYDYYHYHMLCFDIYAKEVFVYRLKLIDSNHPFRPYDGKLLEYVAGIIREKYLVMIATEDTEKNELRDIFVSAIESDGASLPEKHRAVVRQKLGFEEQDCFWMLCLESGKNTGDIQAYQYYCMYLNKVFNNSYAYIYKKQIVLIFDLSRYQSQEEKLRLYVIEFLRNENFRAGISNRFVGLEKVGGYYKQAEYALKLGLKYDPELWVYDFFDYRYHYLMKKISEDFPSSVYIMPELHILAEYDRCNNTEYFQTLRVFVSLKCNATYTANTLNVHRTTLNYRLQKISCIANIDFKDYKYMTLLALFFQLYEIVPAYI